MSTIYKISTLADWQNAQRLGFFRGSAVDLRDGFIHFSTRAQVEATASRHFAGQAGLVLAVIDADALGDALKWEPARGGDLFPHLYGDLTLTTVTDIFDLRLRPDGSHDIAEHLP